MDVTDFESAGLYDPKATNAADRLALLQWFASLGITIAQMTDAAPRGGLVGLAGDLALRPLPHLTLADLSARLGLPAEQIGAISLAVGLRPGSADEATFTDEDLETFQAFVAGAALFGAIPTRRLARTVGAALAQIAEAAVAVYLVAGEAPLVASQASELELAAQNLRGIQALESLQIVLRGLFRAHMAAAIRRQRQARSETSIDSLRLTIGFVDLVGFTTLSRHMTTHELAEVIDRFEESAYEIVAARDGRLVKLIGDEVMFACVDAGAACDIALTLLERFEHDPTVTPRGALACGDLLFRGGDYYGPVVNLAARLADLAVPHEVLASAAVAAQAVHQGLRFDPAGKRMLKGFDDPVEVFTVGRTGA